MSDETTAASEKLGGYDKVPGPKPEDVLFDADGRSHLDTLAPEERVGKVFRVALEQGAKIS